MQGRLICLYGPDGSGKTTIADGVAALMYLKGVNVKRTWIRGSHLYVSLLARFLSKFAAFRGRDNPYYMISIPRKLKYLWLLLEYSGFLLVFVARIVTPRFLGYLVIAERSVIDFIVWILLTLREPGLLRSVFIHHLFSMAQRYKCYYVTASPTILVKRRSDELTLRDAVIQRKLYDYFHKLYGGYVVDTGNLGPADAVSFIISSLQK